MLPLFGPQAAVCGAFPARWTERTQAKKTAVLSPLWPRGGEPRMTDRDHAEVRGRGNGGSLLQQRASIAFDCSRPPVGGRELPLASLMRVEALHPLFITEVPH